MAKYNAGQKLETRGKMNDAYTDRQLVDFLRRSYFAVDGLWFVKCEEAEGFDSAMELDEAVWEVMAKIQSRKAKELLGIGNGGLTGIAAAFQLKLTAEGHDFEVETSEQNVEITIRTCPWFEILRSSGRTGIARTIADRICMSEYAGWAKEFGPGIELEFGRRLCVDGCEDCVITFRRQPQPTA